MPQLDKLIPVRCVGTFPEHLFGLAMADLPPAIIGWMLGLTPYYQKHGITIFRGDCRKIMAQIPPMLIDLVATDPPYGIKYDTNALGKPVRGDDRIFDPTHLLAYQNLILWGANYYAHLLPRSTKWLIWDKRASRGQNCQSDAELAWTKGLPGVSTKALYHYWNGAVRASEQREPRYHPTQKPVALMRWCLELFPQARTIIDPYMGVGTTLVAARQLGRTAIGIEWDEQYCSVAAERVEATAPLLN